MALDDALWCNFFKERWGGDDAAFHAPVGSKSWKDVFEVQNPCDGGIGITPCHDS
ncbi:unnamed protein product [Lupinus luteus]|uniref:Uncharacterized protein n=1 Tax=Lupinus luteus TaxID=3873 RepID=A0AAV1W8W2_LUPLU